MKHKITLEYVKRLHITSSRIDDKIIYLSTMVEYLRKTNQISNYEYYRQEFEDLKLIRNNIIHLLSNSLELEIWNNKQEIHDMMFDIIKDLI